VTTMRDVARIADVSTATVSRILNGERGQASEETVRRVMAAVKQARYVPNSVARDLRRGGVRAITLILPRLENPFQVQVARGAEEVARAAGWSVLLGNSDEDPVKERGYLEVAAAGAAGGVLIAATSPDVNLDGLHDRGVPVVAIIRPLEGTTAVDTILMDTFGAMRQATATLIAEGHTRIGCLPGTTTNFSDRARLAGFRAAFGDAGLAVPDDLVIHTPTNVDGGASGAATLLQLRRNGPLDAIIAANSLVAIGVVGTFLERGIEPGSGITIAAFDDAPWTRALTPYLRVVTQPGVEFGRVAATTLLNRIADPARSTTTTYLQSAGLSAPSDRTESST
jgi:LacI family transcriptional regulator